MLIVFHKYFFVGERITFVLSNNHLHVLMNYFLQHNALNFVTQN